MEVHVLAEEITSEEITSEEITSEDNGTLYMA